MNNITILGCFAIFIYSVVKILNFYGISEEIYGSYVLFYIIIFIFILTLPDYPE